MAFQRPGDAKGPAAICIAPLSERLHIELLRQGRRGIADVCLKPVTCYEAWQLLRGA